MKLWQKDYDLNKQIEEYTVGNDFALDLNLVYYDCLASIAHAKMLKKIKVITGKELNKLVTGLNEIISLHKCGKFKIKPEDEDCHTAIENFLIKIYGSVGKKIHTARSRNDQVLTALRLYEKEEIKEIIILIKDFISSLVLTAKKYDKIIFPGFTHLQKAMPSSIKMWLESYAHLCKDNISMLKSVNVLIDKSPLGSAAGFGVPIFDLDKKMTSKLMGFSDFMDNPIYAQSSRGKFEAFLLSALSQIMLDLNKLATDLMLFSMEELGYISLPKEFCTGSSIMPQKSNPDVLELTRAKYHVVLGEEFKVKSLVSNLISGYNRDVQLSKEPVMTSINITKDALSIMTLIVSKMIVNPIKCSEAMTPELFATKEVYKLIKKGVPFREAYKQVSKKFEYKNDYNKK